MVLRITMIENTGIHSIQLQLGRTEEDGFVSIL